MTDRSLVRVSDLTVAYREGATEVVALDRISLEIAEGEAIGIIGESGSGKSTLALSLLGLLPRDARVEGSIQYRGQELVGLNESELRVLRGTEIGLVYQDALVSLNPVRTVGVQIGEAIRRRQAGGSGDRLREATIQSLADVGISNPAVRVDQYPHQFSGGMRQRAAIAMALGAEPSLLIADEITTALDVTVQAEILELLAALRQEVGMAMMLISHDLQVVHDTVDRVAVLYGGRIVEVGRTSTVLTRPAHPYTQGLVASAVTIDDPEIRYIPGDPPGSANEIPGCPFSPRCGLRNGRDKCVAELPALRLVDGLDHSCACHFWEEVIDQSDVRLSGASHSAPVPPTSPPSLNLSE